MTWEQLRALAGFRATKGYAVSLFVGLDPTEAPTPAAVETRVNAQLDEAHRLAEERRGSMSHEQRKAVESDLERIRSWFGDGFDRQGGTRGVAVYAASLDNFWSTVTLPEPVSDTARVGVELSLAPLASHVREGALVAVVGRERGHVYRLHDGFLVEIADQTDDVPGQHDQGGWSQSRYERHIDELAERHLRALAETLERFLRRLRGVPLVLVGTEDVRTDFESLLSKEALSRIAGWATAEAHADGAQLLAVVRPVLDEWCRAREQELLERWRDEAGRNGRATTGWDATLEAASDGRVELLLVQSGVDQQAYQCPRCGRAQFTDGRCPLDGTSLERRDDGLDLAVRKTLAHGGTVHIVRDRDDLRPVGGVGALLRF